MGGSGRSDEDSLFLLVRGLATVVLELGELHPIY